MKKVLVVVPFTVDQKNRLINSGCDVEFTFTQPENVTNEMLSNVDALIGNVPVAMLKDKSNLQWIQLNSSGADAYAAEGAVPESTMITCATGAYGHAISEYMVGMLLTMMKKLPQYIEAQKQGVWTDFGGVESPAGKRVLLVGTGNIGLEFAKRIKAFGSTVVGIRNRAEICPQELDEVFGPDKLLEQVAIADVIALSLPGTKASYHLFNKEVLKACKKGSYLMNVGRGTALDTKALLEKEIADNFAGIWLDVTEIEPLPVKDPLYYISNLLLTPHITGGYHLPQTTENIFNITMENMKAWLGKGNYVHVVSRKDGYSLG